MLGHKAKEFRIRSAVSLDSLVPEDNFYRQVEHFLDIGFVRELVCDLYSDIGRPSIDPVVFFKLQLIAFFEGIRSERKLMENVNLNLAHRWFIGYDLDEPVPDHSSLSKIRERYGLETFHQFFEQIVEFCIEAGLVWGEELYFDCTKVRANAAIRGMIDRTETEARQHIEQLFEIDETQTPDGSLLGLVAKYNGERILGLRKRKYDRLADKQISPTDPDATPMRPSGGGSAVLGYRDHYIVDGGKSRIILCAFVTPASVIENTPLLDSIQWVRSRWKIDPEFVVGDAKYGTVPNIVGLEEEGIKTYIPTPHLRSRKSFYPSDMFKYDTDQNRYIFPQGQPLPLFSRRRTEENYVYRADAKVCDACPVKSECTDSKSGRHIFRSFHQEILDRAEANRQPEEYQKVMRKRGVWFEPLFGEAKQFHRLRCFRLRGLAKVNIEGVMTAAGQNLKRWIKFKHTEKEKMVLN